MINLKWSRESKMARLLLSRALVFVLFLSCNFAHPDVVDRFMKFIDEFRKPYKNGTHEFRRRFEVFKDNLERVEMLNQPYEEGAEVFGVTKFSDLSQTEFKEQYLNDLRPKLRRQNSTTLKFRSEMLFGDETPSPPLLKHIDWREAGVISPIKNQGRCGACWAFAAAETVESAYAISHNSSAVPHLAVQQLIDCSTANYGCEGGDICQALDYVQKNGITYDANYPLTDKDGPCRAVGPRDKIVKIAKYNCSKLVNQEDQILHLLVTVGPVSAAVDATTWNNYVGGIIQFHCSNKINHAVEIVGYDLTGSVPYYIVRNSWGTDFGIDGYMYIKVGSNLCGIAEEVSDVYMDLA